MSENYSSADEFAEDWVRGCFEGLRHKGEDIHHFLRRFGLHAVPCDCGDSRCRGYQMTAIDGYSWSDLLTAHPGDDV